MKAILVIFAVILLLTSCSITGLYTHEICCNTPDCFAYDFCKNGRFTYWYSQDILGSTTINGDWERRHDTLFLKADKYIFETQTNLKSVHNNSLDSTLIKIRLLPKYFSDKRDTIFMIWGVNLDNENTIYETNESGILKIPYRPISKVRVRDYSSIHGMHPLVEFPDSVFTIDNNTNDIEIYITDNKSEPYIFGVNENLLVRWRRLKSIVPYSSEALPDIYIKKKNKCGNLKTN